MAPPKRPAKSNALVAAGLIAFGAGMALFPLFYTRTGPQLANKEGALSGQAIIRGAYVNTASKDVGIDPDYHKYKSDPIIGNAPIGRDR